MRQVAAGEGGVITPAQCRALGVDDGAVRRLLGAGPWRLQREDWLRDLHRLEFVRWVPAEMRTRRGRAEVVARFDRAAAHLG